MVKETAYAFLNQMTPVGAFPRRLQPMGGRRETRLPFVWSETGEDLGYKDKISRFLKGGGGPDSKNHHRSED